MPQLEIRYATLADLTDIIDLVTSAYRGETSRVGWTTEADLLDGARITPDVLTADLEDPQSHVILGNLDGKLVACIHAKNAAPTVGYLGMFAVQPTLQNIGIGKTMIAKAERILREEFHVTTIEMKVLEQRTELIAFYERQGYQRTGKHTAFPYGDNRFGLPLRDDLRLTVLRKNYDDPK